MAAEAKQRWDCPSDRELILRAKLNSGWSVHSQNYFRRQEPIQGPELCSIENVLERAKHAEYLENERVERMVCRLENMKRNTVGDGKRTCSMCGISFGLFRTSSVNCCDCLMSVCEKCRIDIQSVSQELCVLCKLCAENREIWKKSGGWFYGQVPHPFQQSSLIKECTSMSTSPSCPRAFNTWEHRKPDIVRLESFEPPEENHNDHPLYKNWAVNSSPDLSSLDESISFIEERTEDLRKGLGNGDNLEMLSLPTPEDSRLSLSCPSLQMTEGIPVYKQAEIHRKRHGYSLSRKRILTPARKVMEKITKYRKS